MHQNDFQLHPQLAMDCFTVCDLPLSRILLMNDAQFPWFIQVPKRIGVADIIDLNEQDQSQLWRESALLSESIRALFKPDKLNIAALGNMVPQLHIHHIGRYKADIAWPKPVWGQVAAQPYTEQIRIERIEQMRIALKELAC